MLTFSDVAIDGSAVVAGGNFRWAINLAGRTIWPHGSGPLSPGGATVTSAGGDGLVVLFDWVED